MKKGKIETVIKSRLTLVCENTELYTRKVNCSSVVEEFMRGIYDKGTIGLFEEFYILFLDRKNHINGYSKISEGGYSGTVADGKMIFSQALMHTNCSGIIMVHNHPSGNRKPSDSDISLTNKMRDFGDMIDLPILDHVIMMPKNGYYSFADNNWR